MLVFKGYRAQNKLGACQSCPLQMGAPNTQVLLAPGCPHHPPEQEQRALPNPPLENPPAWGSLIQVEYEPVLFPSFFTL